MIDLGDYGHPPSTRRRDYSLVLLQLAIAVLINSNAIPGGWTADGDVVRILGIAASIFIGFRKTQAIGRWWEARTLWGSIVNVSRSWADTLRAHLSLAALAALTAPAGAQCPGDDGHEPNDCSRWLDGTPTGGTLYPNGNDSLRYGFGAWVMAESNGVVEALVSPGAWGTSPFYDRSRDMRGIVFTYVARPDPTGVRPVTSANTYVFRRLRSKIDALLTTPGTDLAPAVDLTRAGS